MLLIIAPSVPSTTRRKPLFINSSSSSSKLSSRARIPSRRAFSANATMFCTRTLSPKLGTLKALPKIPKILVIVVIGFATKSAKKDPPITKIREGRSQIPERLPPEVKTVITSAADPPTNPIIVAKSMKILPNPRYLRNQSVFYSELFFQ